ncbi:MAG: NFACT family protein, partial [Saprospiraceae bacterium]|nr:NFACT family protein [Pyrinomonadaceae bacterium]
MNISTIEKIKAELGLALIGRKLGKIFQLSRFELAVDFRLSDSTFLFVSVEPSNPRIYLIRRRVKDLEKQSGTPSSFHMFLRKRLSGATLDKIEVVPDERILYFDLSTRDELGTDHNFSLVVQLTGRSANLFLLDERRMILETSREPFGEGQTA